MKLHVVPPTPLDEPRPVRGPLAVAWLVAGRVGALAMALAAALLLYALRSRHRPDREGGELPWWGGS